MTAAAPVLIVTADDYGYAPGYNRGILEAVRAGAVDAVSAMVRRPACEPAPLLDTGVEIGLHLELAGAADPDLGEQVELFERLFGRPPAYLDGHRHCHAVPPDVAEAVAALAAARRWPVRSVGEDHRRRLRRHGVRTADRLIGRMREAEPALPPVLEGGTLPAGVTEWMVHPGHADPSAGSSFDAGREQDLALLLGISPTLRRTARRETHTGALTLPR